MSEEPATLGTQASALNEIIARLTSETVDQEAGSRFSRVHTESQLSLRAALYTEHMQPISRVAREVFGVSGMDRAFRLPKTVKVNQPLLAAAGAMAEAAERNRDVFVQHGMSQDFIEQLRASVTALETARTAKTESARRRVTATAAVKDQVKQGRKAVRLLDAILKPRLAKDPELLAAWRSAKRVRTVSPITVAGEETSSPAGSEKAA